MKNGPQGVKFDLFFHIGDLKVGSKKEFLNDRSQNQSPFVSVSLLKGAYHKLNLF